MSYLPNSSWQWWHLFSCFSSNFCLLFLSIFSIGKYLLAYPKTSSCISRSLSRSLTWNRLQNFSWWLEDIIVGREKPVAKLFLKQMTPKILWGWINICESWISISDCCITYMRIAVWSESRLLQNYSVVKRN